MVSAYNLRNTEALKSTDTEKRNKSKAHSLRLLQRLVLHQRLEALLLLKGRDLQHHAKCAEHQVEGVDGDVHLRLHDLSKGVSQRVCVEPLS